MSRTLSLLSCITLLPLLLACTNPVAGTTAHSSTPGEELPISGIKFIGRNIIAIADDGRVCMAESIYDNLGTPGKPKTSWISEAAPFPNCIKLVYGCSGYGSSTAEIETGLDSEGYVWKCDRNTKVWSKMSGFSEPIKDIFAGAYWTVALSATGKAWGWSDPSSPGPKSYGLEKTATPTLLTMQNIQTMASADFSTFHSVLLLEDGTVATTRGFSGTGEESGRTNSIVGADYVIVPGLSNITGVASTASGSYFLNSNGDVYACGRFWDANKQDTSIASPTKISTPIGASVQQIIGMGTMACALSNGNVWVHGQSREKIGDTTAVYYPNFTKVSIPGNPTIIKIFAIGIDYGAGHFIAVSSTNELYYIGKTMTLFGVTVNIGSKLPNLPFN